MSLTLDETIPTVADLLASPLAKYITLAANDCGYSGKAKELIVTYVHPLFLKAHSPASKADNREMAILFCWQFVLLFVLPAFGHVLPVCIGQNILVNESIFFMPFILFFVRMLDIFHSITNEWAKFDTKHMFFFYFFSHASPTSTT